MNSVQMYKNILTTWKYVDMNDIMNETNILGRNLVIDHIQVFQEQQKT